MRCRAVFGPSVGNGAVVDSAGTIIGVNDRWLRFAREHGARLKTIRAGANYLEECRNAIRHGSADASVAIRGIAGVLDGSLPEFRLEYACSASSEEQWYELIAHPLRRTEGGAILTHLNVTDRRTAEREAQSLAQELARVSRVAVLGELTASLAHELSQPLTAIHTNAQAALHLFSKKRTPSSRIEGILSDIVADNLRAGKIVRHLRTMLKKGQVRFRQIKLNQLIQDVTELLHDDAILRGVRVSLDLDAGLPPIWGERIQLQQVVLNLMVNAFEAMRRTQNEGRELTVRTSLEGPDHASLQLSDTGPGIPESHLDRIFEPFFTTKSGGLGMGLAICRSIIRAHNGEISVANNPGKGVSFRVKLPLFRQGCT
jgi:C4-dicarboxylate-specific signal transduction histidine kinase